MTSGSKDRVIVTPGDKSIYIALGANLPTPRYGSPRSSLEAALIMLENSGILVAESSSWYATAPVPKSEQPDFVNGVVRVVTTLDPTSLLLLLHRIEDDFGRVRMNRNEARVLDLDLIDYDGRVESAEAGPILPHPRVHERAFVLVPLHEIAPGWRHPVTGVGIDALIRDLPDANDVKRL